MTEELIWKTNVHNSSNRLQDFVSIIASGHMTDLKITQWGNGPNTHWANEDFAEDWRIVKDLLNVAAEVV